MGKLSKAMLALKPYQRMTKAMAVTRHHTGQEAAKDLSSTPGGVLGR